MRENVILIGMPGCGKSRLGRLVAKKLGFDFVDLDEKIESAAKMPIPEIFRRFGEAGFRRLEREAVLSLESRTRTVVGTGGGVILDPENVVLLRRIGFVCHVERPLDELAVGGKRPLSTSREALQRLYEERRDLYKHAADATIANSSALSPAEVADRIIGAFYEN
ncbi:MAG: shikimate kinase [Victivallaceae bacterium]|nr:shikimate kinase [Victivallaceae bacterium]